MARTQRITLNDNADVRVIDNNFQILENRLDSAISVTIPDENDSRWVTATDTNSNTYYKIELPLDGITNDSSPIIALKPLESVNLDIDKIRSKMASKFFEYDTKTNAIEFSTTEKPANSFQFELKGV